MSRTLLCVAVLISLTIPSWADEPAKPAETVIRLTVQPMAAPKPALRYLLLPELNEMNPGNPIQNYLKCFSEQQNFFFNKETCERREKLLVMPLKELPAQELRDYGKFALRQADWAARLDKPDWQILLQCKTEGIGLLLPDVQMMRALAQALKVRFRGEVALHHYDDAVRTAKTMFAMSRHMTESPTLISDLVGIAIAFVAIGPLEEMLEQPGCPNLYWALTNLPSPLVSLDLGLQGERMLLRGEFRDLDQTNPMSEEQIKKVVNHIDKIATDSKGVNRMRDFLESRIKDETAISAARQRLIEAGIPEERLLQFPAGQIILLDDWRDYEARRDDIFKLVNFPPWQAEQLGITGPKKGTKDMGILAGYLLPALNKVHSAQGRLEQRIALLRHVEAVRLYAADHEGKLPHSLAEISVPLPVDPFTGKPFLYQVEGATAHLRGTPPKGYESNAPFNIHYEITIQK
ncbi:MAG: hypothetical protein ACJ8FY_23160 [Gemmataceae bacterium]